MNKYLSILIGSAALGLASCSKDTVPEEVNWAPQASNGEVNILNRHSAELSGSVVPTEGQIFEEWGIIVADFPNLDYTHNGYAVTNSNNQPQRVDGLYKGVTRKTLNLDAKKTYYFAPYAKNAMTVVMGNIVPFTMPTTSAPAFDEPTVTKTTETSGTVSARLSDVGSETSVMMRGYIYKEATGGVNSVGPQDLVLTEGVSQTGGFGTLEEGDPLEDMIPNLKPGKTYAVRAYAVAEGVGYSDIAYIQTRATDNMAISVIDARLVTEGILSAYFIQRGNQEIDQVGFCYREGTDVDPVVGNSTLIDGRLEGDQILGQLPRLGLNTTYSIRPYATTVLGDTFYGEISELGNELDLSGYVTREYLNHNYYNMTEVQGMVDSIIANSQDINAQINDLKAALDNLNYQVQNNYVTQNEYQSMYGSLQQQISELQQQQQNMAEKLAQLSSQIASIAYVDSLYNSTRPSIGTDGYWYIGGENTGIRAQGEDGYPGTEWTIGSDGYWYRNGTQTQYKAVVDSDIAALQSQIDSLRSIIDGIQPSNINPLYVPYTGFVATADGNTTITASATLNIEGYKQSYVSAYGDRTPDNDYYLRLYPVSMTGFIYSATNPEPSTASYAAMIVAPADSTNAFAATIEGLSPGTKYYVRAFAVSSFGVSYSPVSEVTTAGSSGVNPGAGDNPYPGTVGVKRRR